MPKIMETLIIEKKGGETKVLKLMVNLRMPGRPKFSGLSFLVIRSYFYAFSLATSNSFQKKMNSMEIEIF